MLYQKESKKIIDKFCADLTIALAKRKYEIVSASDITLKTPDGQKQNDAMCRIISVGNMKKIEKLIEKDIALSLVLPYHICVQSQGNITRILLLRPKGLLALFGELKLKPIAEDLEENIIKAIEEAGG